MRLIRKYTDSDLEDVLSAWENASQIAHPFLTAEFLAAERVAIPTVYLPIADTWVIEQGEKVIGFVSLLGNEVGAIFVQPAFHGSGVGPVLMNKAQELHGELEVEVLDTNLICRNFYKNVGFQFLSEKIHE